MTTPVIEDMPDTYGAALLPPVSATSSFLEIDNVPQRVGTTGLKLKRGVNYVEATWEGASPLVLRCVSDGMASRVISENRGGERLFAKIGVASSGYVQVTAPHAYAQGKNFRGTIQVISIPLPI